MGFFLAFLGFVGLVIGLLQMLKGKKMNAVPFRAPSQIAQLGPGAGDAKGMVSTEGTVGQQGLLTAPMSGKPCLAYEITVERKWEKSERTENGMQTKKGSDNIFRDYKGGIFPVQDGQGTIMIDATERPDASFDKAHQSGVNVGIMGIIPSTLEFGGFQMNTPLLASHEGKTTGFEGTEKIIAPSPSLYALGKLEVGPQGPVVGTPKGLGTGKLILSSKGRAALVKSTKRNMILGYSLGGVMFVGGTVMGILAPPSAPSAASCSSTLASDIVACDGRIYEANGLDMKWTVATAGDYTFVVKQPNVKYPIDATITITDSKGEQLAYNDGGSPGAPAKVEHHFEPGTYTVNVRDFAHDKVKGGYGFHLDVTKAEVPAIASADTTNADVADGGAAPAAKAGAAGVKPALGAAKVAAALPAAGAAGKPAGSAAATGTAAAAGAASAKPGTTAAAGATGTAKAAAAPTTAPAAPAKPGAAAAGTAKK